MKPMRSLVIAAVLAGATMSGGCKSEIKVQDDAPSTKLDTAVKDAGDAVGSAAQEVRDESIEKAVEAVLIAKPGFGSVTVESEPDGVIVLNGTVASENEKAAAQVAAENVGGVKSVKNNLTVAK